MAKKDKVYRYGKFVLAIIFVVALIIIISSLIAQGIGQIKEISLVMNDSTSVLDTVKISFAGFEFSPLEFVDTEKIVGVAGNFLQSVATSLIDFAAELFLVIVLLIFIVPAEKVFIKKLRIRRTLDRSDKNSIIILRIFRDLEKGISEYLKTKTIISLVVTSVMTLIMYIMGVKYFWIFSLIYFALGFIPTFGDYASFVIIFGVQLFTIGLGLKFFLLFFLMLGTQIIFANFLEPKYAGKALELSPLTVFLSLLFWGSIWGVGGFLFSIPFTVAIKTLLKYNSTTKPIAEMIS
jgi:predicted PurR-regulated permease PerM